MLEANRSGKAALNCVQISRCSISVRSLLPRPPAFSRIARNFAPRSCNVTERFDCARRTRYSSTASVRLAPGEVDSFS